MAVRKGIACTLSCMAVAQLWVPTPVPAPLTSTSTNEQALGDMQLQQAWDTAASQAISDGVWNSLFGSEPLFTLASSCVGVNPSTGVVVYPNYPRGTLAATLQRGTIRAAITGTNIQYSPTGQVLVNTNVNPPVGLYVQWVQAIADRIARAYNRRYLTVSWLILPTSDGCLDALLGGLVDVLPASWASYPYNGYSRYQQTKASACLTRVSPLTAWVGLANPVTDSINNMTELLSALRGPTPPKLGSVGSPGARAGVLLGTTPTIYANIDIAMANLANRTVDFYAGVATGVPPQYMSVTRMLNITPAAPLETVTTLFRRPLISGEVPLGFIPSNSTNFPLLSDGSDPASIGDSQLETAYAAGWNRVYASGTWASLFAADPLLVPYDACQGPASMFPFPTTPTGALATVLQRRVVRLGFISGLVTNSPSGNVVLLDGSTNPPTGAYYSLDMAVWNAIGAAYGLTLTVQWVPYTSSDAMVDDVLAGKIDMTTSSFVIGARYRGIARALRTSPSMCFSTGGPVPVWVATTSSYTSLNALVAAVRAGNLPVGTAGAGSRGSAENYFQTTSIVSYEEAALAFQELVQGGAGTPVAVWDFAPPANLASSVRMLGYSVSRLTAPLFRPPTLPALLSATATPTPLLSERNAVIGLSVVTALLAAAVLLLSIMSCAARSQAAHRRKGHSGVGEVVMTRNALQAGTP